MHNHTLKQFKFPNLKTILIQSLQVVLISAVIGTGLWWLRLTIEHLIKGGVK